MDAVVQVVAVSPRTTNSGKALYDVKGADGSEYTVWEADLANKIAAAAPIGPMTIRFDETRKGQYTNRTVRDFAPAGQQLGPDQGPSVGGNRGGSGRGGGMSEADKTRISKMGAQGAAATIVAALFAGAGPDAYEEAVSLHKRLTLDLYKQARSHEKKEEAPNLIDQAAAASNLIQPTASTPAEVAAGVPGVQVGTSAVEQPAATSSPAPSEDIDWN